MEKELKENLDNIAKEIKKLRRVGNILAKSELNEKTIIWLISRASGVPQGSCEKIMNSLQELEGIFLKCEGE